MKARAMEETAIEISRKFGPADEYRYYDNRGTLLGRGNIRAVVDDAFEIEYSDIEPDNDEFWSRRGNPKPALIEKIEDMELMSLKK